MIKNYINIKIFQNLQFEDNNILLLGYNRFILNSLPLGSTIIEPSQITINQASSKYPGYHFHHGDFQSFSFENKYTTIISLDTLHLSENISETFNCIYDHLKEEGILCFPLSPNQIITNMLDSEKWQWSKKQTPSFQKRTRSAIEDAILPKKFKNIIINEEIKTITFESADTLKSHIKKDLEMLSILAHKQLDQCVDELCSVIYKDNNPDELVNLSYPYIVIIINNTD